MKTSKISYFYMVGKSAANQMSKCLTKGEKDVLLDFVIEETAELPTPGDCTPLIDFRVGYLDGFFERHSNQKNKQNYAVFLENATRGIDAALRSKSQKSTLKTSPYKGPSGPSLD